MGYDMTLKGFDFDDDGAYFRLNVHGMGRCRDAMLHLRMAHGPERSPLRWPEPADFGLPRWPDEQDFGPAVQKLRAAETAFLGQVGDEPGIPLYKLSSNDGWWIRPAECRSALRLEEHAPPGEREYVAAAIDWWDDWLAFLRRAAEHDGIVVE